MAAYDPKADISGAAAMVLKSQITCPECGFRRVEVMPTDTCQFFYECSECKAILRPKLGDCCVFCSYGSAKCPSKQTGNARCCE